MSPFACIYVPNFSVAAALRAEPELQARPLAIFEGKPLLEKIIATSEKASSLNIAPGMTKAQAEVCPELVLRPRSLMQENSTHAALLDCAQSFSPCVEDAACDTVLLDLSGMGSLFGSLTKISHAIADRATDLGLEAKIAAASNPDTALLSARGIAVAPVAGQLSLGHPSTALKTSHPPAPGSAQTPKVVIIPPGKEAERLGLLPVEVLFDDHLESDQKEEASRLLETLDRWGIRNLRALAALPEVALSERLGQQGLYLQRLARGAAIRTLVPVEVPLVFEEATELEHPIVLLEPLAFLLNRLLEQICARLASRALATQELRLTLELSNLTGIDDEFENIGIPSENDGSGDQGAPPLSRFVRQGGDFDFLPGGPNIRPHASEGTVRRIGPQLLPRRSMQFVRKLSLPLPMLDPKVFLKLLQLDLNAHPPGAPIVKIHLSAEPARPRSAQGGLFLPPSPEPEKLELTLARIAGIVGEQKVGALEMLDTHHPEGFRMRRFVAEVARKVPQRRNPDSASVDSVIEKSAVTALRRFRPPLRVHVKLENSQPVKLIRQKTDMQGEILWRAGPWRFSGDWWEREAWSRDEWDVALQTSPHTEKSISFYRLVHDLLEGVWFIEGAYD